VLGLGEIDPSRSEQTFVQLGGDSLAAVRLSGILKDTYGIDVPVPVVLDPTVTVRGLVERAAAGAPRGVTFEQVHGSNPTVVRAADVRVDRFLSAEDRAAARDAAPPAALPPSATVALLTGGNGFLGRFLVLEALARLPKDGVLYAVVRAPTDELADERLRASFQGPDPALAEELRARGSDGRLVVLAGDLMKPRLGLPESTYARLAAEVDCVVHNAALVNHAFGYRELFEPNLLGTAEMLRFAVRSRIKALAYVSTVGAVMAVDRDEPIREDEDIRTLLPERTLGFGYASGYSISKWASEILLRDANERLGVPVRVFRPSGIMAHTKYRGQINAADFFTRLLCGIVYTGIAPTSFYEGGARGHYDGLPVDVVARSIAALALTDLRDAGSATYQVVNPYRDDGVSLDVIVDWVETLGYRMTRIDDYAEWYRTFHDRLAALADPLRQRSPLAILDAWAHPARAGRGGFDVTRLRERLGRLSRPGEDLAALPHVDEALIDKYLEDMDALGLIGPPAP
jgi:fatty acid CoA ligase FadD9